jgi:hypothetical protein
MSRGVMEAATKATRVRPKEKDHRAEPFVPLFHFLRRISDSLSKRRPLKEQRQQRRDFFSLKSCVAYVSTLNTEFAVPEYN